jgi:hypothetical protein
MADNWGAFKTWDLVLPPNRPTDRFVEIICREAALLPRKDRAAVLGATPELRDLAHRLGFHEVVVFDRDREFYNQMSQSLSPALLANERLVYGDWLATLPEARCVFDLVLSDLTSGNLPYVARRAYYGGIAASLDDEGIFIDRALVHDFQLEQLSVLQTKYYFKPCNLCTFNNFSSDFLFCSELLRGKDTVDSSEFYYLLAQQFGGDAHLEALLRGSRLITPEGSLWYYGRPAREIWDGYSSAFSKIKVERDELNTVFSGKTRIIICSRS